MPITPSPICTVNGSTLATTGHTGIDVAASSTITIALANTAGVSSWNISATSGDDVIDLGLPTDGLHTINNSKTNIGISGLGPYTFVMPAMDGYRGAAIQFTSTVNSYVAGNPNATSSITFGVFVDNGNGNPIQRLVFGGMTNESNATVGNAEIINDMIAAFQGTVGPAGAAGPPGQGLSQALNWVSLTSGWNTLYTLSPNLGANEVVNLAATINLSSTNGLDGYSALWSRRFFGLQNFGGAISDPVGNTSDVNSVTPVLGSYMASSNARIAISGSTVVVQAQPPTGIAGMYGAATVDLVRGAPGSTASILSVSPNVSPTVVASPTTITIYTTVGAATGATAATVDGVSLTSITVISSSSLTGVLPANTYSAGTGNVTVTSPANPNLLSNGFTFGAATLTALSSPLMASANGGGSSITLSGTNLNGVTSVTVGAASATSLSSTSTTVTFTPPANTASATPYNITFTGTLGSATLTGALYSIPGNITHCWYAPQYNSSAGTWADLVAGTSLAVGAGSYTKPSVTSSWTNSQPGVTFNGTQGLINTSTPSSQAEPASIFAVYNVTATTTYNMVAYGGVSGNNIFAVFQLPAGHAINIQAGGASFASTLNTSSTPQLVEGYFLNGTNNSSVNLNNGTAQAGSTSVGAATDTGFAIGTRYDGGATISSGLIGSVGVVALYNGTPTSGERTLWHSIMVSIYGVA